MGARAMVVSTKQTFMVPEERAVLAIEQCANKLFEASTIQDVQKLMGQAEAVAAWVRATEATEQVKRDAQFLAVRAERRLGEITAKIPKGLPKSHPESRKATFKKHNLQEKRVICAEKLAAMPAKKFEQVIQDVGPRATVTSVVQHLGFQDKPTWAPKTLRPLAEEAIDLLRQCCKANRAPRRDEVNKLELRLAALNVVKK